MQIKHYAFDENAGLIDYGTELRLDPEQEENAHWVLTVKDAADDQVAYTIETFSPIRKVLTMRVDKSIDLVDIFDMLTTA